MFKRLLPAFVVVSALASRPTLLAQTDPVPPSPMERVTFEEAVKRATDHNPTVKQATQAILRAQALLDQAKAAFRPTLYGEVGETILDAARGFGGGITQPKAQAAFSATASYPVLAAWRWAQKSQAADQVGIARISAEEIRRQVALTAAQSYLAVIAAQRQRDISVRNRDTARALADYGRARLEGGQGSKLNYLRSSQELASSESLVEVAELQVRQAQEALGVALFSNDPIDANGDPEMQVAPPPTSEAWLTHRPDVRLFSAQLQAAERVVNDSWKSWLPTANASFTPRYVDPAGLFEPAKSWRAFFQLQIPIYDGTLGAAKRIRIADRETARLRLETVRIEARSELRVAQEAVVRTERAGAASGRAADDAREALRITEVAYKAGATSNIEVVQAQQGARNAELIAAVAEDRLRQARLDLLVALGEFPR